MGKKKNTKNAEKPKRYAGVRFSMDEYYLIGTDGENITMTSDINGVTKDYDVTGGGGGGTTIEPLEVTANGTYEAPSGTAYNPVTVNVGDEYEEVTIWTNPDPNKGLKVDTEIAKTEDLEDQHIEYIKIIYREINTKPDRKDELTLIYAKLVDNYAGALVSTGDYNEDIDRNEYYARPVFFNGNWGGVYFGGECREISAAATNKNFRAVPEVVYGYRLKEV